MKQIILLCERISVYSNAFNGDIRERTVLRTHRNLFEGLESLEAVDDPSKYSVHVIQMQLRSICNKKLRSVLVGAIISHAYDPATVV